MTRVVVLLPGQGEQQVGMLHRLPTTGEQVLQAAAEVLGHDPLTLDAAEDLATTTATQIALLLTGAAWYDEAIVCGLQASYLCGQSVGLWTAAVCAGALELRDAIRLVRLRGEAMQAASGPRDGMLAVIGLAEPALDEIAQSTRADGLDAWVSVLNAPYHVVVSGTAAALVRVQELAEQRGAQRVTRLAVAIAAHCPLMAPAGLRIRSELESIRVSRPTVPLAANTTARLLRTPDEIRDELWRGVAAPVRWADTTASLHERGADAWLQVPPGHALARLAAPLGNRAVSVEEIGMAAALRRVS